MLNITQCPADDYDHGYGHHYNCEYGRGYYGDENGNYHHFGGSSAAAAAASSGRRLLGDHYYYGYHNYHDSSAAAAADSASGGDSSAAAAAASSGELLLVNHCTRHLHYSFVALSSTDANFAGHSRGLSGCYVTHLVA